MQDSKCGVMLFMTVPLQGSPQVVTPIRPACGSIRDLDQMKSRDQGVNLC